MINKIKHDIKTIIKDKLNVNDLIIEIPKRGDSDLAIPLFSYQKSLSKPLMEVFELFKNEIIQLNTVSKVEFAGGFLNIYLEREKLSFEILKNIHTLKSNYGDKEKNNEVVVIDYSSPNIAKSFSVGHLRSTVIGNSLKLIFEKQGYQVVGINHLGDWGTQFGRMIVAYNKWGNKEDLDKNPIDYLQSLYVRFHNEAEKDESLQQEARDAFLKLEQKDPVYLSLWQHFRDESLKEFMEMYELLNVQFDSYNGEAFYNDKMDSVVEELEEKNLLVEDQGAMVVKVDENQPPVLIKRSDGATLYATRDLAALLYRYKTYNFSKILYVVGNEQKLHFENLKKVSQMMGYNFDLAHVNFGLVLVGGKKMSTREGKTQKLIYVINEAIRNAKKAIEEKNPLLEDKESVAKSIGVGAIIFNDLKNERHLDIDFNMDNMLKFEGQTGPYLQYAIVRIFSILRQNQLDINFVQPSIYQEDIYFNLIKLIDQFPHVITKASEDLTPSTIARYLLNLSQEFNGFYAKVKINDENLHVRHTNLLLVDSILNTLVEGLRLLGIKHLEAM